MKQLYLTLLLVLLSTPVFAQAPPDTLCIPVEQARAAQKEIMDCRDRLEIRQEIINELKMQVRLYETRIESDSTLLTLREDQIGLYEERLEVRDDEIRRLQRKIERKDRLKYLWFAGGAAAILLGSYVAGNAR